MDCNLNTKQNYCFLQPYISFNLDISLEIEIETQRLYIISYKDSHFENCVSLYGNELITKYFDHGTVRNRQEVEKLIHERAKFFFTNHKPFGLFSIFRKEDMEFIGQIDLLPLNELGTVEIGFIINEKYQNRGYCTEAVKTFMFYYVEELNYRKFGRKKFQINKIIATVHPENQPSIKILEKVGMSLYKVQERFGNPRLWYSISTAIGIKNRKKRA